jgi:5-methylcytosine-specific restriction endonuclease McrA
MVMKALLLDASYFPIQIIDWKKAMILFFAGRAEVIEHHEDIEISSPNQSFRLPKVMRLFANFRDFTQVKFNRNNVFYRDRYRCQYCGDKFVEKELTFDHVMPKSRGGPTNWINIVTCCHVCNNKKADRTPEEARMPLLKKPVQPKWSPMTALQLGAKELQVFATWLYTG